MEKSGFKGWMTRLAVPAGLAAVAGVALVAWPSPSHADCNDPPEPGVVWTDCEKERLRLNGADLRKATLVRTDFNASDLSKVNLSGAMMAGASFDRARLHHANLSNSDMTKVEGPRGDFFGADLSGTDLSKSDLPRANLQEANLSDADLSKSEMGRTDFRKSNLTDVTFEFANIARADLRGATLTATDFSNAYTYLTRWEATDLSQSTGLSQYQLDISCGNAETKLPAGLTQPESWPCPHLE